MAYKVGLKRFFYQDANRSNWDGTGPRPLVTDVWYPATETSIETDTLIGPPDVPFFKVGKATRDADLLTTGESFPLILLSHGTGGVSLQLGWLASYLASQGFILAAVNHHGNNGLEPYVSKGFLHFWERAKDLTVVLNQLLSDENFGKRINPNQIGAAGFSLGGYTVLAISGGVTNIKSLIDSYKKVGRDIIKEIPPEFTDTAAFVEEFNSLDKFVSVADTSHCDERIKAVFSIAPVHGEAFSQEGLSSIKIPVKIIVGDADGQALASINASYFARHIKNAELTILEKVGHYTFLGEGTEIGKQELPMFCLDEHDIDRASIHQTVSQWAKEFFDKHLKG